MTVVPAGAVSIRDGEIVLSADVVAPALGLSPEALQAEMRHGRLFCHLEKGVGEEEGRARVTVRYHAQSWTIVVEADGRGRATTWHAAAIPAKKKGGDGDHVAAELRRILKCMAAAGVTVTYQGLAGLLSLSPPNTIHQVTVALERLMEEDAKAGHPFIAALAISKARNGLPAVGFFDCAHRLGRFKGDAIGPEACSFHAAELKAAERFWGGSDPDR